MFNEDRKIGLQFNRLENRKQKLIDLVTPMTGNLYNLQPSATSWSAGQVANHLYLSESASFAYLKKKMSYPDTLLPYSIKSWRAYYTTKLVLFSPLKTKAPQAIDMWTGKSVMDPHELDLKWNELRTEMKTYIHEHYPNVRNKLVYNHPFAGRMTLLQMLMFFNDHLDHHTRQVRRIMKAVNRIDETKADST